jgi:hypothetical protein
MPRIQATGCLGALALLVLVFMYKAMPWLIIAAVIFTAYLLIY